jgi:hypothetical protein
MMAGELSFPNPVDPEAARTRAMHVGAKLAADMDLEWDPFNVNIAISPTKQNEKPKK